MNTAIYVLKQSYPVKLNGEKMPQGAFAHPVGLTCGAFEQLFGTGGQELTAKNRKIQMPG